MWDSPDFTMCQMCARLEDCGGQDLQVIAFFGNPGLLSEKNCCKGLSLGICSLHFLLELLISMREPNSGRDVLGNA